MNRPAEPISEPAYDFFISYAHSDNYDSWITECIEALEQEHLRYHPQRYQVFFDRLEIRTMDDWGHRILTGLRSCKLMFAMLSPRYFESEYCCREWQIYLEHELDKAIQGEGIVPIYMESVPAFDQDSDVENITKNSNWLRNLRRRQYLDLRTWRPSKLSSLQDPELSFLIRKLEQDIFLKLRKIEMIDSSQSNLPPHNTLFTGRDDELRELTQILAILVQGMAGSGKSALAFEYAHQSASKYPGGRFMVDCSGITDLYEAMKKLTYPMHIDLTLEEEKDVKAAALKVRRELESRPRSLLLLENVRVSALLAPHLTTRLIPSLTL